jgi:hypothetical protein
MSAPISEYDQWTINSVAAQPGIEPAIVERVKGMAQDLADLMAERDALRSLVRQLNDVLD